MSEKVAPPLGILYLAAYLRKQVKGLEIRAIDGPRHGYRHTLNKIFGFSPDILCVSYYVVSALGAYALINTLKKNNPQLLCVVGGHHVTAIPGEALNRSQADIEVYHEGELTLTEIVKTFQTKKNIHDMDLAHIPGIGYLHNHQLKITPERPFISDINTIPFPARDLLDMSQYHGWYITRQTPQARVIFSRGCPYHCTFCSNKVWNRPGSGVRIRSAKNIGDELETLKDQYGVKEFFDDGDEFNLDTDRAIEICHEIKKRGLGMTWKCQLRCNNLTEELVQAMAASGCWYVHLGIESGNQRTLNGINKNITLEQAESACSLLKRHGIQTLALFMLFNVWEEGGNLCYEGEEETRKTLAFAKKLLENKQAVMISAPQTQPYPGSKLYDIALRHNLIKNHLKENWDAWLRDDMYVMALPGVKESRMAALRAKANIMIAIQMLKLGHLSLRDTIFFIQKSAGLIKDNIKVIWRKNRP